MSAPPTPLLNVSTTTFDSSPDSPADCQPSSIRPSSISVTTLSPRSPHTGGGSFVASLVNHFNSPSSASSTSASSFSSLSRTVVSPSAAPLAVSKAQQRGPDGEVADVKHVYKSAPYFNPHHHTMPFSAVPSKPPQPPTAAAASSASSASPLQSTPSAAHSASTSASSPLPYPVPVLCTTRSVTADWTIDHDTTLGSGFSSTVKLATSLHHSGAEPLQAACKIIDKRTANVDLVKFADECRVLSGVTHGNIVDVYGSYEDDTHVYVLTEVCQGGELFDLLCERGEKGMDEWEAAPLIAQLLEALAYLHGRGICHRDVKPENCLFLHPYSYTEPAASPPSANAAKPASSRLLSSIPTLKLTDFGFAANLLTKPRALRASSHLGSLGYTAPEIFSSSSYTESCDVWSVGAILHIMMTGLPPYTQLGDEERKQPFWLYVNEMHWGERQGQVTVGGKAWEGRSDEVQELVRGMLELDVAKRLRASEALQNGWVKEGRERWRRANAAAEQMAGEAGGWSSQSVRERTTSKASAMLTMREVMAEIVQRAGQTKEVESTGSKATEAEECKVNAEADNGAEDALSDGIRPEKRTVAQRRMKALTMVDWGRG